MKTRSSEKSENQGGKVLGDRTFWKSVNAALEGLIHAFQGERNMRVHFFASFIVLIMGIYFDLRFVELILLLFAITFVLITEMLNTAIEKLSDLVVEEKYDPTVKMVKDIAAGAVFVAAINALITGYILMSNRVAMHRGKIFFKIQQSSWHLTFIALIVCVVTVIAVKVIRKEKNLLKGGMPSGHTAIAFSIWMILWTVTDDSLVSIMVFILAFFVARSRMANGIHSVWEVIVGAVLGALSTLLIFQVLSW